MPAKQICGKRYEHHGEQQQEIEPQQPAIHRFDHVHHAVVRDPIDADDHESKRESEHVRSKAGQRLQAQLLIAIEVNVKNEERNHDGEHAIAERLQSLFRHRSPPNDRPDLSIGQVSIGHASTGPEISLPSVAGALAYRKKAVAAATGADYYPNDKKRL
jgi:hypothetical protein